MAKKEVEATKKANAGSTKVMACKNACKSAYQDQKYGTGIRVHNVGAGDKSYSCTACGKGGRTKKS